MRILIVMATLLLAGCAGIPHSTLDSLATAGGGCAKSQGIWGSLLVMVGGADKGTLRNGEVEISGDCSKLTIRDESTASRIKATQAVPGTVTTIVVPGTTTTTVAPLPKP